MKHLAIRTPSHLPSTQDALNAEKFAVLVEHIERKEARDCVAV